MEDIRDYRPNVLKDEVPVLREPLTELFKDHQVYVFGYGSLVCNDNWSSRNMTFVPKGEDLKECTLNGFKRGPWGLYGHHNFYGVIRKYDAHMNGVVVPIWTLSDWVELMSTEMIAGLYDYANYRVVDVTDSITGIKLPVGSKIHCVCNRPNNRVKMFQTRPFRGYYSNVWQGIKKDRSSEFGPEFLNTGGFICNKDVSNFIEKRENAHGRKVDCSESEDW